MDIIEELSQGFQNKPAAAGVPPATSNFTAGYFSHDKAIPINCFVSHRPTDPLFFKVPFKENITDPYFWKFQ